MMKMIMELEGLDQAQKLLEKAHKIRRVGDRRVRRREGDLRMIKKMRRMKVRGMRSEKRGKQIGSLPKVENKEKMQISIFEKIIITESIAVTEDIHQSLQDNLNPIENIRETLLILIIGTNLIEGGHLEIDTIVKDQGSMNVAVEMIIHPNDETDPCQGE